MLYPKTITIPASKEKSSPAEATLKVPRGIVNLLYLEFPAGCHKEAHVVVFRAERQVWPTDPDEDFAADDITLFFPEEYWVEDLPLEFTVKGWNDDTANSHKVTVGISMVELELFEARLESLSILEKLKILFGIQ